MLKKAQIIKAYRDMKADKVAEFLEDKPAMFVRKHCVSNGAVNWYQDSDVEYLAWWFFIWSHREEFVDG